MKKRKNLKSVQLFRTLLAVREVTLRVDGKKRKFDLFSEFSLTKDGLKDKFFVEAEQFMFFRSLLAEARAALRKAEDAYHDKRSIRELDYRAHYEEKGEPKSDWAIKCLVDIDKKVEPMRRRLRRKQLEADKLEAIVSGLFILKSMTVAASEDRPKDYNRGDEDDR